MTGIPPRGRGALEVILFEESRFRGSQMFTAAEVTIGNDPGVMVNLPDATLSPCHAVLRFDGETCLVANYDEGQGTNVNGESIAEQSVGPTDEIGIGRFKLRIAIHRADATPPPVSVKAPTRGPVKAGGAPAAKPSVPTSNRSATVPMTAMRDPVVPPKASAPAAPKPVPPVHAAPVAPSIAAKHVPSPVPASKVEAAMKAALPAGRAVPSPVPPTKPTEAQKKPSPPAPAVAKVPSPPAPAVAKVPSPPAPAVAKVPSPPAPAVAKVPLAPLRPEPRMPSPPPPTAVPVLVAPEGSDANHGPMVGLSLLSKEAVPLSEIFEVTTERNAMRAPSGEFPLPYLDDDDEAPREPSFSLYENLLAGGAARVGGKRDHAVEVVRFRHGCVVKLRHLRRGENLRLPGLRKAVGRSQGRGSFWFHKDELPTGAAVVEAGQPVDDEAFRRRADKRGRIQLDPSTQVVFPLPSGEGVLVHLVPAATELPRPPLRMRLTKLGMTLAGISVFAHILVFLIIGLTSLVKREYIADNKDGRFARIALKEIEIEPPAPPVQKKEKKQKKAEVATSAPTENAPKVTVRVPRTKPTTPQEKASATAKSLLSALGGLGGGQKSSATATAMSNLDAAGPVKGGGGFKVSGAIGKLPGDSLRLASAGSGIGQLNTKGGKDLGKDLGRVLGKGPSGRVRAQVAAKPAAMKVEGHLDRGEIAKVINAHIHELQGCYERQLFMNPNLAGKLTFEWIIGTSGLVTSVKIKSSTVSSNEATSCMQSAIRGWKFPSPSGGHVTVIFPFVLSNSST